MDLFLETTVADDTSHADGDFSRLRFDACDPPEIRDLIGPGESLDEEQLDYIERNTTLINQLLFSTEYGWERP